MSHINIEIKARTNNTEFIRKYLHQHRADFKGIDLQTDTYFNTTSGRLKLRQGNIENSLIYYDRQDLPGPKQSNFELLPVTNGELLKSILVKAMGVRIIVKKSREIFFLRNVKFHIDNLESLGTFVEIEATNIGYDASIEELRAQCDYYMREFGIREQDLIKNSYSDMLS